MKRLPVEILKALHSIELFFISLLRKIATIENRESKFSAIYANLLICRELTQQELATRTQYSLASISNTLKLMSVSDVVQKSIRPGTHTHIYSIKPNSYRLTFIPDLLQAPIIEPLETIILDLKRQLSSPETKKKNQIIFLKTRLEDLKNYVQLSQLLQRDTEMDFSLFENAKHYFDQQNPSQINFTEQNQHFTVAIEEKLIKIFSRFPLLNCSKEMERTVLILLITRYSLTQKQLHEITQFSTGVISKILNHLLSNNVISLSESPKSLNNGKFYTLKSPSLALLYHICQISDFLHSSEINVQSILIRLQILQNKFPKDENVQHLFSIASVFDEQIKFYSKLAHIAKSLQVYFCPAS